MSVYSVRSGRSAARNKKLSVMFLGLRGLPDVQGGIERHVEQLAPLIAASGHDTEVLVRSSYVPPANAGTWRGVRITRVWCWRNRILETLLHSFLGVLVAAWRRPDILHVQGIGPALFVPLARLLGLKVVVTHHGFNYDHEKWGAGAKTMLRLGERFGMRFSNARIVISKPIAETIRAKHNTDVAVIPNGVKLPRKPSAREALDEFALTSRRYVLTVSRIVPEKRHLDLIQAFAAAHLSGWKLAIVGAADHPGEYSRALEAVARETPGVVLAGFQTGARLDELFAHAGVFVLPSSHEGLPIALLEALAAGSRCLASDISANREVGLPDNCYFPLGDTVALGRLLRKAAEQPENDTEREARRAYVASHFDWDVAAQRTIEVYCRVYFDERHGIRSTAVADQRNVAGGRRAV